MKILSIMCTALSLVSCDPDHAHHANKDHIDEHTQHDNHAQAEKGPHGGRLLQQNDFILELTIFETGLPPEFRIWASKNGDPVSPNEVDLQITLTRLGGKIDQIEFSPQGDFLRGDMEIYEPHSFLVSIQAKHEGNNYQWEYENFEGRTHIDREMAEASGLKTTQASAQTLIEHITLYGEIMLDPAHSAQVSARFDGVLQKVGVAVGDVVKKGQVLARVESNESLTTYSIRAPIGGSIIQRNANVGESTQNRNLFTILDTSSVWVQLAVFPSQRNKVKVGDPVLIMSANNEYSFTGEISYINIQAEQNQAVMARVELDNAEGLLVPGSTVTALVTVARYEVPLAVKRAALQNFRDFNVVYAQFGDTYEVRMLELGRQDDEWVEVLSGLEAGTIYVSENSYLVKADIEKSGASHDH